MRKVILNVLMILSTLSIVILAIVGATSDQTNFKLLCITGQLVGLCIQQICNFLKIY